MPDSVEGEILEDRKNTKILVYGYASDASSLNPPIKACTPLVHWVNLWVISTIKCKFNWSNIDSVLINLEGACHHWLTIYMYHQIYCLETKPR